MTEIVSLDTSVHLEFHYNSSIDISDNRNKEDLNKSSQYNIKKATPKNHARNQQQIEYAS